MRLEVLQFSPTCKINQVYPVLFPAACEFVSREKKKKTISCSLVLVLYIAAAAAMFLRRLLRQLIPSRADKAELRAGPRRIP